MKDHSKNSRPQLENTSSKWENIGNESEKFSSLSTESTPPGSMMLWSNDEENWDSSGNGSRLIYSED